jgi:hypothetical protein
MLYHFILLTSLMTCCHVTDSWSFVSVFNNSNNRRRRNQHYHHLFLSGDSSRSSSYTSRESQLVNYLVETFNSYNNDRLPCGLACTDKERQHVSNMVNDLLLLQNDNNDSSNNMANNVKVNDVLGEWNLLYTSSRTMIINKSLSGLGRSESDKAKVKCIRQKLSGSKYVHVHNTYSLRQHKRVKRAGLGRQYLTDTTMSFLLANLLVLLTMHTHTQIPWFCGIHGTNWWQLR